MLGGRGLLAPRGPAPRAGPGLIPSRIWVPGNISPLGDVPIAHGPGRRVMKLEIKGVGTTIPDHRHPCPPGGGPSVGPEIAGDEVVQAEPSGEVAGWGLHAWVKVGGLRVCQLLLCVSSSPASRWPRLRTPGRAGASLPRSRLVQPRRALQKGGQGEVRAVPLTLVTGSGRAPLGREPEEEEWDGPGRGHAQGGRTARGARAGGVVCLLPICAVGRADRVEGPATPSPACGAGARASRLGSASALRRGAPRGRSGPLPRGPGRPRAAPGGAAEGPRGARSGFPAAFPGPHRRAGVRAGGVCLGGVRWRAPLRVSSDISSAWEGSPARRSQDRGQE